MFHIFIFFGSLFQLTAAGCHISSVLPKVFIGLYQKKTVILLMCHMCFRKSALPGQTRIPQLDFRDWLWWDFSKLVFSYFWNESQHVIQRLPEAKELKETLSQTKYFSVLLFIYIFLPSVCVIISFSLFFFFLCVFSCWEKQIRGKLVVCLERIEYLS